VESRRPSISSDSSQPPLPPTHLSAVRVRLLGAELVRSRQNYMVYKLHIESHADLPLLYRRFSQFAELLQKLGSPSAQRASKLPLTHEQVVELAEWHRRLRVEKRHAGALAFQPQVVSRRCVLLQQLLDEVLSQPPHCFQPEVSSFFGMPTLDPAALHSTKGPNTQTYMYQCAQCNRRLRINPQASWQSYAYQCSGCGLLFKVGGFSHDAAAQGAFPPSDGACESHETHASEPSSWSATRSREASRSSISSDGMPASRTTLAAEATASTHLGVPPPTATVHVDAEGWPQPSAPPQHATLPHRATPHSKEPAASAFFGGLVRKASDQVSQLQRNAGAAVTSVTNSTRAAVSWASPPAVGDAPSNGKEMPAALPHTVPHVSAQQSAGSMAAKLFAEARAASAARSAGRDAVAAPSGGVANGGFEADAARGDTTRAASMAAELFDSVG